MRVFTCPSDVILTSVHEAQAAFRAALCDSFNTPEALNILREVVSRVNVYINTKGKDLNVDIVAYATRWVGKMLRMFGLGEGDAQDIGWGQDAEEGKVNVSPLIRALMSKMFISSIARGSSDALSPCTVFIPGRRPYTRDWKAR